NGAHPGDFIVTNQPAASIGMGETTRFTVRFDPTALGVRTAVLHVNNDDEDEADYDFAVTGLGVEPEIEVLGTNLAVIASGDITPAPEDGTDFGEVRVYSATRDRTFTITNAGTTEMIVSGVIVDGLHAADFSVMNSPTVLLPMGGTTNFMIRFDPSVMGARMATVHVYSDDDDEPDYTFAIKGTGVEPEIAVLGTNHALIVTGDITPTIADGTDFGEVRVFEGTSDHTFIVTNSGTTLLNITGLTTNGVDAPDFIVTVMPDAVVPAGTSTTFVVQINPSALGERTAIIHVLNDDADEPDYEFTVRGVGVEPEMAVLGTNLAVILDGETTTSLTNGTDFGAPMPMDGGGARIFTITNSGSTALDLTGTPRVVITGHTNDFSVTVNPDASIPKATTTTFTIEFEPVAMWGRTAEVHIVNSDADENPYDFTIRGEGPDNSYYNIFAPLADVRGHALAWGDYDNDGYLDLILAGYTGTSRVTALYRNSGAHTFTPVATALPAIENGSLAWGDYDNDGDLDLAFSGYTGGPPMTVIYRNDGGGVFTDIEAGLTGVYNSCVAWGDYNNDGKLDLAIAGYTLSENVSLIYKNMGSDVFTNINANLPGATDVSLAWGDYDNDNDLDLLLSGSTSGGKITRIYNNAGSDTFTNSNRTLPGLSHGQCAWGDYDNDGDLDIALTGYATNGRMTRIYRNDSNRFVNIAAPMEGLWLSSLAWGDHESDGDLDLLVAGSATNGPFTVVYENSDGLFTNIAAAITGVQNCAVAWGDYDNDGDLDIAATGIGETGYSARIYRNYSATHNQLPSAPTNLSAFVTNVNQAFLSWDRATDLETPATGLSYNIYLGTAPFTVDMESPAADTTSGWRRVVAIGNAQCAPSWTVNDVPIGTSYWAVQTIDSTFAGSTFSTGAFVRPPLPDFLITDIQVNRQPIVRDEEEGAYADPSTGGGRDDRPGRVGATDDPGWGDGQYYDTEFSAFITVSNAGESAGDAGLLSLWLNQPSQVVCGAVGDVSQPVGILTAGQSTQVVLSGIALGTAGTNVLRAFIDSECVSAESNEVNNQATYDYIVLNPVPLEFAAYGRTNSVKLTWSAPYYSGASNNLVMVRWNTGAYPTGTGDGQLLYTGTNLTYIHTNLSPYEAYYYRIWITLDGFTFVDPTLGTNRSIAIPQPRPMQLLMRSSETFTSGGKQKTSLRLFPFKDDESGIIDTNNLPDIFSLATTWTVDGCGNFNPVMDGDEVLIRNAQGALFLLYFDETGNLDWDSDTGSVYWTSCTLGADYATNAASWYVDAIGDVNGDRQDELVMRSSYTYQSGGKTKTDTRVLFFDTNGTGRLQDTQPTSFAFSTDWTIEGMGNFNTHAINASSASEQLLLSQNRNGALYLLYFTDNGVLDWDDNDTNSIYWTSLDYGPAYATNDPTQWTIRAIGDVNGDGQDELVMQNGETFEQGGKTKADVKVLLYTEDGTGCLRTNQPPAFSLSTAWSIEGLGNFTTTNINGSSESSQLLLRKTSDNTLYLLFFNDDGSLAWDDDTNAVCWTAFTRGSDYATNATAWSIQAIGDFRGVQE
ncbi:MAG: choice-of-anchor D domain-containing protein, partial [Spartobacteria bacterium]|nr:choice-of-anchor D domain-containing protein [Spartobacteria bacterium]